MELMPIKEICERRTKNKLSLVAFSFVLYFLYQF